MLAIASVGQVSDWVRLRGDLEKTPGILGVYPAAISGSQVDFSLSLAGSHGQVISALAAKGYKVTTEEGYWIVSR